MPGALPRGEEPLEHVVDEVSLAARIHDLLILGFFLELEDMLREELERTVQVGLDRADRPGARRQVADGAMEIRRIRGRPVRPHLCPAPGVTLKGVEGDWLQRQRFVRKYARVLERLARQRRKPGARDLVELH